jgi:hypothetical protein
VPPKAALRSDHAPLRDGRPGSLSDLLGGFGVGSVPKLNPELDASDGQQNGDKNPEHDITAKWKGEIRCNQPRCQGDSKAQVDDERPTQSKPNEMFGTTKPLKKKCDADSDEDGTKETRVERVFDSRQANDAGKRGRNKSEHEA